MRSVQGADLLVKQLCAQAQACFRALSSYVKLLLCCNTAAALQLHSRSHMKQASLAWPAYCPIASGWAWQHYMALLFL